MFMICPMCVDASCWHESFRYKPFCLIGGMVNATMLFQRAKIRFFVRNSKLISFLPRVFYRTVVLGGGMECREDFVVGILNGGA